MRATLRLIVLTLLASALVTDSAAAQVTALDEGVFRIYKNDREVGGETFTIQQSGVGESAIMIARGRVQIDTIGGATEHIDTSLEVSGPLFRASGYNVRVDDGESLQIAGRMLGGRFSARIVSPSGERMREYLASEGAVVVDQGVAHHYFFLANRDLGSAVSIPVIIPRLNRQVTANVSVTGVETIRIGGEDVSARRLRIATADGGGERFVWIDAQGRILRVEVPGTGYRAERMSLPQ